MSSICELFNVAIPVWMGAESRAEYCVSSILVLVSQYEIVFLELDAQASGTLFGRFVKANQSVDPKGLSIGRRQTLLRLVVP